MAINDSTIRSNVWQTVYDELDGYSFNTSVQKITSAYPDSEPAFPLIIIHPIQVTKGTYSLGDRANSNKTKAVNVSIDLYTKRADELDSIADDLHVALEKNFTGISLVESDEDELGQMETSGGQKVHGKAFSFSYIRR